MQRKPGEAVPELATVGTAKDLSKSIVVITQRMMLPQFLQNYRSPRKGLSRESTAVKKLREIYTIGRGQFHHRQMNLNF